MIRQPRKTMPGECTIYFHAPCFDGIVSAVLMWDFLSSAGKYREIQLDGVNYDLKERWLSDRLRKPCAVVDFLYHPDVEYWADHHVTTFLTESAEVHFRRRHTPRLVYDSTAPSCARLLWRHLRTAFGYRNRRYGELVAWADITDSARYTDAAQAIRSAEPALMINASLALTRDDSYSEELVRRLRHMPFEDVARLPDVQERYDQFRLLVERGMERLRDALHMVDGGIAVFDVSGDDVIVSRYAPFHFFPEARYSVGVVRSSDRAKITAMRNPWKGFRSAPLGKIFQRIGGGGHSRVGSVILEDMSAQSPETLENWLIQEIRKHERRHVEV